ncbi:MAG: hypothetical protein H6613_02950 [Ignavibacteriales bacterium]|nr:hypothetical protein [Ignavibacteriales bacterium]
MNEAERKQVGKWVNQSKSVLSELVNVNPEVVGKVGDSQEIYSIINARKGIGQIIGFSENPISFKGNMKLIQIISLHY